MKFLIMLKDPDGIYEGIQQAAIQTVRYEAPHASAESKAAIAQHAQEKLTDFVYDWLEFGDYAFIAFDTDAKTAQLLTSKEAEDWK